MSNLIVNNLLNLNLKHKNTFNGIIKRLPKSWLLNFQNKIEYENNQVEKIQDKQKNLCDYALLFNDDFLLDFCLSNKLNFDNIGKNKGWIAVIQNICHCCNIVESKNLIRKITKIEEVTSLKLELSLNYMCVNDFFKKDFFSKEELSDFFYFVLERVPMLTLSNSEFLLLNLFEFKNDKIQSFLKENIPEELLSKIIFEGIGLSKFNNNINVIDKISSCVNMNDNVFVKENCVVCIGQKEEYIALKDCETINRLNNFLCEFVKKKFEEIEVNTRRKELDGFLKDISKAKKVKM